MTIPSLDVMQANYRSNLEARLESVKRYKEKYGQEKVDLANQNLAKELEDVQAELDALNARMSVEV